MEDRFKPLDDESEHKDTVVSFFSSMFKVGELVSVAMDVFRDKGLEELNNRLTSLGKGKIPIGKSTYEWFNNGTGCELLSPGAKGWQKGKVRIKVILEFCPDEPEVEEAAPCSEILQPESSLDDIRQMMNQETQQNNS